MTFTVGGHKAFHDIFTLFTEIDTGLVVDVFLGRPSRNETRCCGLDHVESGCISVRPRCYAFGGEPLGKGCRPAMLNCPNCRANEKYKKRTRHMAVSTLCKFRIDASFKLIGMSLKSLCF